MRHTFRLNVKGKGYTLYSENSSCKYQDFPLDIQSKYISQNYLCSQRKIDALLETQTARWSICIANNNVRDDLVTAYGCLLPIPDDKGRIGISFIHAIESGNEMSVEQVVILIGCLLAQKKIGYISNLIGGVAKGNISANELIEFFTNHFRLSSNNLLSPSRSLKRFPIKEIQQDCGGATLTTWLAMATSHADSPAPWEIYEEYSHQTDTVSTISSLDSAKNIYLLSEYLHISSHTFQNNSIETSPKKKQKHDPEQITTVNANITNANYHKTKSRKVSVLAKIFVLNLGVMVLIIASLVNQFTFNRQREEELKNMVVEMKYIIKSMRR